MSKKTCIRVGRFLLIGVIIVATLAVYGLVINLAGRTLCPWWPVALVSAVVGAALSRVMSGFWMWLTDTSSRWFGVVCGMVAMTGVAMLSFYGTNAWAADETVTVQASVERRYTQTRYHSRRVGRRTYARGAPYKVYKVEVRLPDGQLTTFDVGFERYNRARKGKQIPVELTHGLWGADVVSLY